MASQVGEGPVILQAGRWSIGRFTTDLAIVAVAVPFGLRWLEPPVRGECSTTLDNAAMMVGLGFLAARLAWFPMMALNDAFERRLAARESRQRMMISTETPSRPPTP